MTDDVLRLDGVTFRRNGTEILHGIDLVVRRGEHWALLGPNGAGKSTILGFCGAQEHPTSGTVDVLERRLGRVDMQELRRHIGHVNPRHPIRMPLSPLEVALTGFTGTVDQALRWSPTAAERERAGMLIDMVGLDGRADLSWPTMSQGERGRSLIARALAPDPALLLLDEPTTGLDVAAREQLLETIDALFHTHTDLASVLVTHHLEELPESTTHAMVIAEGRVVAAGPAAETITSEIITEAFRHPIDVAHDDGRWSARTRRRAVV
ncbi:iron complex transport system ATP-binding protein [Microbacterium sp. ZKA21]|jgi:iron complex transport system ATP-binding protein|uniref:ABC transporter ATP-binding protein n=1 Tax=Microbacterium sp. ZKA21 TaxID=3381694 RepID=UPI003D1BDB27